jgi:hypothetical protein
VEATAVFDMKLPPKGKLVLILAATLALASAISHALVAWLRIETETGRPWIVQSKCPPAVQAFICGSSLAGDGIAWGRVSDELHLDLVGWGVAGSSPWEWEVYQRRAPDVQASFVIVSAYDLNENFLCDFHASVVSPLQTIRELFQSHSGESFDKRVLSQYPLAAIRVLFPTAGRSQGVMAGLRDKMMKVLGKSKPAGPADRPAMDLSRENSVKDDKAININAWSQARLLRRLDSMRVACGGKQSFDGPKQAALIRMLQFARKRGETVVIVLPVSATYKKEFIDPSVRSRFEQAIGDAQKTVPGVRWVRLDEVPGLDSDDHFWDLVHMNSQGKTLATQEFLKEYDMTRRVAQVQ